MMYDCFDDLFSHILQIKSFVVKLKGKELKNFKLIFYNQDFPLWRLDMLWEFIWNDIEYTTMLKVFINNKII